MRAKNIILTLFLILLSACTSGGLEITDARASLALPTDTGAVYLTITNRTAEDEALLGAEVPGCGAIEIHEMRMEAGVMRMNPVPGGQVDIPAGETVEFASGGLHLMCLGKRGSFTAGEEVTVTLNFAAAGEIMVAAEIVGP